MANKNARLKENVNGKYYVDDSCIACDACCVEAPRFFAMNDDDGHAFVKLQPKTPDELEEAENALAACPVEAIGSDG
jgi:ferredoxin